VRGARAALLLTESVLLYNALLASLVVAVMSADVAAADAAVVAVASKEYWCLQLNTRYTAGSLVVIHKYLYGWGNKLHVHEGASTLPERPAKHVKKHSPHTKLRSWSRAEDLADAFAWLR